MTTHYFLVSLKPFVLGKPSPMSSQEFMRQAHDVLDEQLLVDLERINTIHDIERQISQGCFSWHTLWFDYWSMLKHEAQHSFLKQLAHKALRFHKAIADELYGPSIVLDGISPDAFDYQDALSWPNRAQLKKIVHEPDPCALEQALIDYFIREIDESVDSSNFSSDQIFAYFYKLIMNERINPLNRKPCTLMLQELIAPLIERALHA